MKHALLSYQEGERTFNLGDNVQSLAARQFLKKDPILIDRERLYHYAGDEVKLIMNGWFTHNLFNWVPSKTIHPLFVSFHLNSSAAPFLLNDESVAYLKKHEPIGCRDRFTVKLLKEKGVEAYFSGCMTLTLDNYKVDDSLRGDDIYIVDPFYNYPTSTSVTSSLRQFARSIINGDVFKIFRKNRDLKKIIHPDLFKKAKYKTQVLPKGTLTEAEKFTLAENYLKDYAKAKLVITSRIHCALPCLAMGIPVIFINGFNSEVDTCRFDGIINLFNRIDVDDNGRCTNNFNLNGLITADTMVTNLSNHLPIVKDLKETCTSFIEELKTREAG
ncbi:polysaccharide pyruvyl transferase family protein [Ancylomarina sp. 16SWW S1-10-2]|uniref:polysaccharide pyruvyl transferase family protein n=1 Tax=Ancylomarina sp. 16SWW S1-10-2 TaxID=2499681 RepID=UPI0012ADA532|nr:polysaccharide pyruvyl transferase family protein [Ancylomarina sp. 16SWW S1-10-2]MRT93460.1 polysaccharide pyruvyl transferase family protein [Ancylomarina sp. 16SWW S1-10-2]